MKKLAIAAFAAYVMAKCFKAGRWIGAAGTFYWMKDNHMDEFSNPHFRTNKMVLPIEYAAATLIQQVLEEAD